MDCEFCKKTFSSKSNLYTHQNSAKFCLGLQGKEKGFECEFCKKKYAQKKGLISHIDLCTEKIELDKKKQQDYVKNLELENKRLLQVETIFQEKLKEKDDFFEGIIAEKNNMITKLETMVASLQKTISDIALQPKSTTMNTTTNTNNSTNMTIMGRFDINDTKQIGEVIQKYLTKDVVARGQEGIALMLSEHLLKGPNGESLYDCTDVSRQSFEFINVDGNVETDPKATKLIRSIGKSGLSIQANVAADKLWTREDGKMDHEKYGIYADKVTEVMQLDKDSAKLRNKLASVMARPRRAPKKTLK